MGGKEIYAEISPLYGSNKLFPCIGSKLFVIDR
jgi:hypothetical protein